MDVGEHGNRRGQGICRPHLIRGCLLLRWSDRQQRDDNSQPEGHPKPVFHQSNLSGFPLLRPPYGKVTDFVLGALKRLP